MDLACGCVCEACFKLSSRQEWVLQPFTQEWRTGQPNYLDYVPRPITQICAYNIDFCSARVSVSPCRWKSTCLLACDICHSVPLIPKLCLGTWHRPGIFPTGDLHVAILLWRSREFRIWILLLHRQTLDKGTVLNIALWYMEIKKETSELNSRVFFCIKVTFDTS